MSMDIALPAVNSASGGPPGAGPPTPADLGQAFAALLAQQGSPPLSRPTAKSPNTSDQTGDEVPRKTKPEKNADKDGDDDPASAEVSLASQTALPPNLIVPAAALIPSGPPVPPAPPAAAANIDRTSEAMDTRPASAPALQSGAGLISGGELLPQSPQSQLSVAEPAPASALPNALPQPASVTLASTQDLASSGSAAARSAGQAAMTAGQAAPAAAPNDMSQAARETSVIAPTLPTQKSDSQSLPSNTPARTGTPATSSTAAIIDSPAAAAAPSSMSSAAGPTPVTALAAGPNAAAAPAASPVAVPEKTSAQTAPALTKPAGPETAQTVSAFPATQTAKAESAPAPAASNSAAKILGANVSAGNAVPTDASLPAKPDANAPVPAAPVSAPAADPASQSTKTALQGYAQFTLQNQARPANNTGIKGDAPAAQGKGVPEESVSPADGDQAQLLLNPVPAHAVETLRESTRQGASQDDTEKNKSEVSGSEAFSEMLTPTNSQSLETKTATVSATAPLPNAGRAALMDQAAAGMQAMHAQAAKSGHGQMTLQLHPQDWGKLQVSVTMAPSPSGTVVIAHLVADSAAVKHALESSGADLKRTLRDAGLHLDNFTVTVRPAAAGSEAQTTGGNGKQSASHDTLWGSAPGSRGEGAASTAAGNGGTAFGGGGANAQSQTGRQRPMAASLITATTNEPEEQTTRAATSTARRLDTRA